jgi:hypothetical protein
VSVADDHVQPPVPLGVGVRLIRVLMIGRRLVVGGDVTVR